MTRARTIRVAIGVAVAAGAATADATAPADRIERLNAEFLRHLSAFEVELPLAVESIRAGWREAYQDGASAERFVPDALAVLNASYGAGLAAFDAGRPADAVALLEPLRNDADEYLAANAAYYYLRALVDLGRLEEADRYLSSEEDGARRARFTPFAPHLLLLAAYCRSATLRESEALAALARLADEFPDAPEPVAVAARQLRVEIERSERGTLGEVSSLMNYAAGRLKVADAGERVRARQSAIVELLDRLIEEEAARESQGAAGGGRAARGGRRAGGSPAAPARPRDESQVDPGRGEVGELRESSPARPEETWGQLPPAERERILQSLRERFPSRYHQLVEQYYRSLAEQK